MNEVSTHDSWLEANALALEALDLPVTEREAFLLAQCDGRPDLRAEVDSLLRFAEDEGPLDHPPALALTPVPIDATTRHFGPWKVTGVIGEGGMGIVFRATRDDGQFARDAAIKCIAGLRGTELLRRFQREKIILSGLDHPNIARLEDAGVAADGTPYLVLELVDGVPIDVYAEAHHLNVDARCRLFLPVCRAVHYAHQRLVLHRDLKPSNILVTADGRPKLLDFGIAKLLGSEEGATAMAALTPAYASPEQFRNLPVSTASDVYSLGVLLYQLLSGRRPYALEGKSLADAAAVVCDTAPTPSHLDGDLDAILGKALDKDSAGRYASAADLASDLENHLAGRPVQARTPTVAYVARKFIQRNRTAVAISLLAGLGLAATSAVAVYQWQEALRHQSIAQTRFDDIHKLANSVLTEFDQSAAKIPGSLELRRLMVRRAAEYLDDLVRRDPAMDPALGSEVAEAYLRLGGIQGDFSQSNLGDRPAALKSFGRARSIYEGLVQRNPDSAQLTAGLGKALTALARLDPTVEAVASQHWESANRRFPNDYAVRSGYANGLFAQAMRATNSQDKIRLFRQAMGTYQEDNTLTARRNQALVHKYLSGVYENFDLENALHEAQEAERIDADLVAARPSARQPKLDWSFDLNEIANQLEARSRFAEAESYFTKVLTLRIDLLQSEPKDVQARDRVAYAEWRLGRIKGVRGDKAAARKLLEQAIQRSSQLWAEFHLLSALETQGFANLDLASASSSCEPAKIGRDLLLRRTKQDPGNTTVARKMDVYRSELTRCRIQLLQSAQ